jgi:hypothetical protein
MLTANQLDCTDYHSFLPSYASPNNGRLSHRLYDYAVDHLHNETLHAAAPTAPGLQYSHVDKFFYDAFRLADLSQQIDQFLALPQPEEAPRDTLWVFNVGAWDVWALSAMPLAISEPIVAAMGKLLFEQVERLYEAARDETSIAWSDPDVAGSKSAAPNSTNSLRRPGDTVADGQGMAQAPGKFTVVVPMLLDPSLYPAWTTDRPALPKVHSKAEQLRNAAMLTNKLNAAITQNLVNWIKAPPRDQMLAIDLQAKEENRVKLSESLFMPDGSMGLRGGPVVSEKVGAKKDGLWETIVAHYVPKMPKMDGSPVPGTPGSGGNGEKGKFGNAARAWAKKLDADGDKGPDGPDISANLNQVVGGAASATTAAIRKPLQKDGFIMDYTEYIVRGMADRQMRDGTLTDKTGLGRLPPQDSFRYLTSCMSTEALEASMESEAGTSEELDIDIMVAERKARTVTGRSMISKRQDVPQALSREWATAQRTNIRGGAISGGTREVTDTESEYLAKCLEVDSGELLHTVRMWSDPSIPTSGFVQDDGSRRSQVCDSPDDHLFHTPFLLSQRVIIGIAERAAKMIGRNESLRMGWEKSEKEQAAMKKGGKP